MAHALLYSLRARLILIVLAALIPCGFYALYTYEEAVKYARIEAVEDARRLAILTASNGRELFDGGRQLLKALTQLPPEMLFDKSRCEKFFQNLKSQNNDFANIALFDADGLPVCSSKEPPPGLTVQDSAWFRRSLEGKGFSVSEPGFCRISGKPGVIVSTPLTNDSGNVSHVLALSMVNGWIERLVSGLPLPDKTTISIINRSGKLMARYPSQGDLVDLSIPKSEAIVADLLHRGLDTAESEGVDGVKRLYAFAPLYRDPGEETFVRIGIPTHVAYAAAEAALRRNLMLIAAVAGLAILATAIFGNVFILRHTNGLLTATRRLASGDMGFRIGISHSKGELAQIAKSFDAMADALEDHARNLRQAEENYRSIFENSQEAIFRTSPDGRPILVNPAAARMLGYEGPQEVLDLVTDIGSQVYADPKKRAEIYRELKERGFVANLDVEARRKDGSTIWVSTSVRAIRGEDGEIKYLEGFASDITRRKTAEELLSRSEANFRTLFENAQEGIFQTSPEGRITMANPALAGIFGYDSAEELMDSVTDIGAQLYVDPGKRKEIVNLLDEHASISGFEFEGLRRDGSKVWLSLNVRAIKDAGGKVVCLEGLMTDVTRRRNAEERLRHSEANYRTLFENAPIGILQSTPEGRYIMANDTLARMYGYDGAEDIIESVTDIASQIYADPRQFEETRRILREKGELTNYEAQVRRKDGSLIWTSRNMRAVRDDTGNILYYDAFSIDIDKRKRAEEQLILSNRRKGQMAVKLASLVRELRAARIAAEEASRAKSEFLARMSHEIRTPINAVLGLTDAALHTQLTAEQRDYLEMVQESADTLLTLINDILDFSKIEARKLQLENIDFDLRAVVHSTIRTLSVAAESKGLCLDLDIDRDVPRVVKGDPARLRQIIVNLVGNALKFTAQGGVSATVRRQTPGPAADDLILFTIKDTGMGISPDRLAGIFEEFRQSDNSIARKYGGTGLGLSICKQLAHMMDGQIWAQSTEGEGSVFSFTVRLAPGDEASLVTAVGPVVVNGPSRSLEVLLVEDNPINVKVGETYLKRMGHNCHVAGSGKEAIWALTEKAFDVVLMDLEMPEMDGFETTRRIRAGEAGEQRHAVPIIALTAHAVADYRKRCLAAGMDDYISKPVKFLEMAAILERIAGTEPLPDQSVAACTLDSTEILDTGAALARLGGDHGLLQEIVDHFVSELPGKIETMRAAAIGGEFDTLRRLAHNIKSNAMTIGACQCASKAFELEEAAKHGREDSIATLTVQTENELERLKRLLAN